MTVLSGKKKSKVNKASTPNEQLPSLIGSNETYNRWGEFRQSPLLFLSAQRTSLKPSSFQGDEGGGRWAAAVHGVALRLHFVFQQLQLHQLSTAVTAISARAALICGPREESQHEDRQICRPRQHKLLKCMQLSSRFAGESAFVCTRVFSLSRTYR